MSRPLLAAVCLLLGFWAGIIVRDHSWFGLCLPWLAPKLDRSLHAQ